MSRDLLSSADLGIEGQARILERAAKLKKTRRDHPRILDGRSVAMLFEKPSTRTRVSFEVAAAELGAHPFVLRTDEVQLGRGETIGDTARVLSRMCDAIVIRTFGQERVVALTDAASVPVINALSDHEHPCQALADLMTIGERFEDPGTVSLCYLGDGNNVCHSLLLAGALAGLARIAVASPPGYGPEADVVAQAEEIGNETGTRIEIGHDPQAAARGARAVYTDVWVSMGQEAERAERLAAFRGYAVTSALMATADPGAIALHCLPAHRGEEIDADVIDGPASAVWDQAENRLHTAKAVLEWALT